MTLVCHTDGCDRRCDTRVLYTKAIIFFTSLSCNSSVNFPHWLNIEGCTADIGHSL